MGLPNNTPSTFYWLSCAGSVERMLNVILGDRDISWEIRGLAFSCIDSEDSDICPNIGTGLKSTC